MASTSSSSSSLIHRLETPLCLTDSILTTKSSRYTLLMELLDTEEKAKKAEESIVGLYLSTLAQPHLFDAHKDEEVRKLLATRNLCSLIVNESAVYKLAIPVIGPISSHLASITPSESTSAWQHSLCTTSCSSEPRVLKGDKVKTLESDEARCEELMKMANQSAFSEDDFKQIYEQVQDPSELNEVLTLLNDKHPKFYLHLTADVHFSISSCQEDERVGRSGVPMHDNFSCALEIAEDESALLSGLEVFTSLKLESMNHWERLLFDIHELCFTGIGPRKVAKIRGTKGHGGWLIRESSKYPNALIISCKDKEHLIKKHPNLRTLEDLLLKAAKLGCSFNKWVLPEGNCPLNNLKSRWPKS